MDTSVINASSTYHTDLEIAANDDSAATSGMHGWSGTMRMADITKKMDNSSLDAWSKHMYVEMTETLAKIDKQIEELKANAEKKEVEGYVGMASAGAGAAGSLGSLAG